MTKAEKEEAKKRTIHYVLYSKDSKYIKRLKMLNLEAMLKPNRRKTKRN